MISITLNKALRYFIYGLIIFYVSACVSVSQIAHQIVTPAQQTKFSAISDTLAQPFYRTQLSLAVSAPDKGTINAAIIDPGAYDPEIGLRYKPYHSTAYYTLNFPLLPAPPDTPEFNKRAKAHPAAVYAQRLDKWLANVKKQKPVGTIILLSGFDMNKASMLSWALFFADRGWRVVLVDLRGQGSSKSPYLTWGIRDRSDLSRLVKLLDMKGELVRPWVYFGVSYGAGVALMAANRHESPDGVIAIAPWDTAAGVIPRFGRSVGGWLVPSEKSNKWQLAEEQAGKLANINLADARPIDTIASIKSPILIIGGSSDQIAPASTLKNMATHSNNSTVVLEDGLGHIAIVADIPGLCSVITGWLNQYINGQNQDKLACKVKKSVINKSIQLIYTGY